MTEAEWLVATDSDELIRCWHEKVSERKLRLFAVACCRRIWDLITEECSRRAVKTGERYADGGASFETLEAAFTAADRAVSSPPRRGRPYSPSALDAARLAAHPLPRGLADSTAGAAAMAAAEGRDRDSRSYRSSWDREKAHQSALFRDITGNPFRIPPVLAPAWLTWNGGTVATLAQSIYDAHSFDRLPLFADALEDAGCTDAELLAHCRSGGEHVRGCWAVDLLLGKM